MFAANARKRGGYVLVMFVMMFFCLMGLAALVIDMGFARLAQRQMQSAVDSAALEGLRWQAVSATNLSAVSPRQQASQMVASLFSDYVDSSGGTIQYGAGPVVNFSGGISPTDLAASQFMSPGSPPVYQPISSAGTAGLELNQSNATEGDIVAGTYNPGQPSAEADNYTRADFTPSSGSSTSNAFLVRMRRTNNVNGLDQESGISSAGPPLPVLFGRGSLMARSGSPGQLSVASGITVRATAIAGPQPAKTVGPLYASSGTLTAVAQLAPFAITDALWTQVSGGTAVTVNPLVAGSGAIILDSQFQATLTAIGQPLVASTNDGILLMGPQSAAAYVAIYADLASQPGTIVGFVYYNNWSYQSGSLTLGPAAGAVRIGGQNVSPTMALPLPAALASADAARMFQDHATLCSQNPLYAPALVNRYIGTNQSSP